MEPAIYARYGVDACFVGHPMADTFAMEPDRAAARIQLGLAADSRVLALLPGSRTSEIHRLLPAFLGAARLLAQRTGPLQILVPAANAGCRATIEAMTTATDLRLHILDGHARAAMVAADAVLLASGTAALEALLAKRPMVVGYRIAALTHFIVKRLGLLKVDRYSLPNVLANERLVPELMQEDCTAENLAAALLPYFNDPSTDTTLQAHYRQIHESLRRNADVQAANAVAELLAQPTLVAQSR